MSTAVLIEPLEDAETDAAGEVFDPELHASKPDGTPAKKTDGTFRKKRRDAAGARRRVNPLASRGKAPSPNRDAANRRAKHVKGVKDAAAVPVMVLGFVDPVTAYVVNDVVAPFAEAAADYAQENELLAGWLDKASTGGGLMALLAVVAYGGAQVAAVHGKIPEQYARGFGLKTRAEVEGILRQTTGGVPSGEPRAA